MPLRNLRTSPKKIVDLLRAEIEREHGQPELNMRAWRDYRIDEFFDRPAYDLNSDDRRNLVIDEATLVVEPRLEQNYWVLSIVAHKELGPRAIGPENALINWPLTIDEFCARFVDSGIYKIAVRLTADTPEARTHFDRWWAQLKMRHPAASVHAHADKERKARKPVRSTDVLKSEPNEDEGKKMNPPSSLGRAANVNSRQEVHERRTILVGRMLPAALQKLVIVRVATPLLEVAQLLGRKEANLVLVCNSDDRLVGVIAKTDIVRQMSRSDGMSCRKTAANIMTRDVAFCRPSDFLTDVWSLMKERGLKHIPLIDSDGRVAGLLIARDVLEALLEDSEYEEELLRDYVFGLGYR